MTAWPAGLPYPRADGAGRARLQRTRRFEVDSGPAEQDPTSTAKVERLDLTYRCTRAQADSIWTFFEGPAAKGGVWFDYTHPFDLTSGQARFIAGQEPKETPTPPKFDMAISLEFRS